MLGRAGNCSQPLLEIWPDLPRGRIYIFYVAVFGKCKLDTAHHHWCLNRFGAGEKTYTICHDFPLRSGSANVLLAALDRSCIARYHRRKAH